MIQLMVADDHPVVREGLKRIVADQDDMTVVAEATSGDEVLEKIRDPQVQLLLLDISMPGPGFLETLKRVKTVREDMPVLVLSVHSEDQYALRALKAGASGYLTKDHSPEELAEAVRKVAGGGRYVSSILAERIAFDLEGQEKPLHRTLSDREYQFLVKLAGGGSLKQIAEELALSPKTVSTYRARVLEKMNLSTNAELIRYALDHDLVD
jgi:two-component system invasion response regulator UvrY